jgi:putative addiction module CopG family antidote
MPRRVAQNISLTPEHAAFIAAQVASGRYAGVSDVVRAALNTLAARKPPRGGANEAGRSND